jgi:hypothetical protein
MAKKADQPEVLKTLNQVLENCKSTDLANEFVIPLFELSLYDITHIDEIDITVYKYIDTKDGNHRFYGYHKGVKDPVPYRKTGEYFISIAKLRNYTLAISN